MAVKPLKTLEAVVASIDGFNVYTKTSRSDHLATIIIRLGWDCPSDIKVGEKVVLDYVRCGASTLWKGRKA